MALSQNEWVIPKTDLENCHCDLKTPRLSLRAEGEAISSARGRLRNLMTSSEQAPQQRIDTHPSGARNDRKTKGFRFLNRDLGVCFLFDFHITIL